MTTTPTRWPIQYKNGTVSISYHLETIYSQFSRRMFIPSAPAKLPSYGSHSSLKYAFLTRNLNQP